MSKDYFHHSRHKCDFQKGKFCKLSSSHCWLIHLISFPCIPVTGAEKPKYSLSWNPLSYKFWWSHISRNLLEPLRKAFPFLQKSKRQLPSSPTSPYLSHLYVLAWKKICCLIIRQPFCTLERTTRIGAEREGILGDDEPVNHCKQLVPLTRSVKQIKPCLFRILLSGFLLFASERILSWFKPQVKVIRGQESIIYLIFVYHLTVYNTFFTFYWVTRLERIAVN